MDCRETSQHRHKCRAPTPIPTIHTCTHITHLCRLRLVRDSNGGAHNVVGCRVTSKCHSRDAAGQLAGSQGEAVQRLEGLVVQQPHAVGGVLGAGACVRGKEEKRVWGGVGGGGQVRIIERLSSRAGCRWCPWGQRLHEYAMERICIFACVRACVWWEGGQDGVCR